MENYSSSKGENYLSNESRLKDILRDVEEIKQGYDQTCSSWNVTNHKFI